jgi:protein-S-isoprenylcysteine O-methyltransferase Ste14
VWWRLTKTAIFSVLAPGTVGVLIPFWLQRSAAHYFLVPSLQIPLGILVFVMGAGIYLWCARDFAVKGLGTPAPIDAPKVLVVQGLYRFTRNPMYVGVSSMVCGQMIYWGSSAIAVYLLLVIAAFSLFVIFYEEPALRR